MLAPGRDRDLDSKTHQHLGSKYLTTYLKKKKKGNCFPLP